MSDFLLLQKEEEYHRLNEQLQDRSKRLMEEFDSVMKKQDNLLKETFQNGNKLDYLKALPNDTYKKHSCWEKLAIGPSDENDENKVDVSETVEQMGTKGMGHFYRSKIKSMILENDKLRIELKNKCEEVKNVEKDKSKLVEEKEKWFQAYNANKGVISKLENQIASLTSKINTKEAENASFRKEMEQAKKDLKNTATSVASSDLKLNRAAEENEKLKAALKVAKQDEKDLKETHRKEINEVLATARKLEKQKIDLMHAFKKQLQLTDNLKRQKACLEASKLAQLSENEFLKLLDWKI